MKIFLIFIVSCLLYAITTKASASANILPSYPDNGQFFLAVPEISDKSFVAGNLGIIDPSSTGDCRLLVIYRYMQMKPLSDNEQNAVLNTWLQFGLRNDNISEGSYVSLSSNVKIAEQQIQKLYHDYILWRKTRFAAVDQVDKAVPPSSETFNDPTSTYGIALDNFYSDLASKDDQLLLSSWNPLPQGNNFLNFATQRLQRIETTLATQTSLTQPEKIALLQHWIAAQQSLFAKHNNNSIQPDLSAFKKTGVPLLDADVDYMRAANDFLSGNPQLILLSSNMFAALAANANYPWKEWMRYMQYRAISVAASQMAMKCDHDGNCQLSYNDETHKLIQQAMQGMLQLAKETKDPAVKSATEDYISILEAKSPDYGNRLYATLQKYIDVTSLSNFIYLTRTDSPFNKPDTDKTLFAQILQNPHAFSNFEEWLISLHELKTNDHNTTVQVFNLSYQQWLHAKQNHAWLWLALVAAEGADDQNQLNTAIKAALKVSVISPDYFSLRAAVYNATYQQPLQYFKTTNAFDQFTQDTAKNVSQQQGFATRLFWQDKLVASASSIDKLLQQTFMLHTDWTSWGHDTSLRDGGDSSGMCPGFSLHDPSDAGFFVIPRATATLNELPLKLLTQVAQSPLLPERFKPAFYVSVWERAWLLQNYALATQLENTVAELNPTLKPSLDAIYAANTPDEKRLQFLTLLLHYPRISPVIELGDYADWRPIDIQFIAPVDFKPLVAQPESFNTIYADTLWSVDMTSIFSGTCKDDCNNVKRFLNAQQQQTWQRERQQIKQLPEGAIWVTQEAISLAKKHPKDSRNAELLALAIQATRFTTTNDPQIHTFSKQAYILLHQLYPTTSWAKNTKFYY